MYLKFSILETSHACMKETTTKINWEKHSRAHCMNSPQYVRVKRGIFYG